MAKKLNLIIKFFRYIVCLNVNTPPFYPAFEENVFYEAK